MLGGCCSGEQRWGTGVSTTGSAWDSAHHLSDVVSPLTGCQRELAELEMKEQSLSGHTHFWRGLFLAGRRLCTRVLEADSVQLR